MTFEPEFKKALQQLSDKEKDKLILRLLKHDLKLANRLHFELVNADSVEDRREQVAVKIAKQVQGSTERYYSIGYLMMDIRDISGEINEHVFIAKDKVGEISLNCLMIRNVLELNNERIASSDFNKAYKIGIYIIARIFKILVLINKQHEDLHIEFSDDIEAIGKLIGQNHHLMRLAIHNGLDVNWLIQFNIPDDIADIHKSLREQGYLK